MDEVKITVNENKSLFLGNNEYETGVLTVPANGKVAAGALLKRDGGKFAPVTATGATPGVPADGGGWTTLPSPGDIPVAVNPVEIKNNTPAPVDIPFRALISGRVRRDMLSINGQAITDDQADMLRSYGIIPKKVTDISWVEEGEQNA